MDDKRQEDGSFIWYITIIGALGVLNLGYDFGISTTVGPELLKQDQFEVTSRGVELFNGLGAVGALFGALVSNFFADRFGRKTTLIISEVVFLIGLTGAVASQNLPSLLVNRIISGFGLGMIVPTSAVYLSELVSPKRRGRMVSWVEMFSQIGTTIAYIIGSLLSSLSSSVGWRVMLALAAIIPIAMLFFLLTFMPESPRWLIAHDQEAQAIEILREITKDDESKGFADAESLAKEIKEGIQSEKKMHDSSWEALFFPTPSVQQAMLVGFGLAAIQQLALPTAITMYMLFIMERDGIASSDVFIYLVLIGVVRIITVYIASRLIDMSSVGRRPLMLGSGGATALLLLLFAILFSVPTSSATTSMLVATMFFYAIAYQIGYGPGLYVILAEIFPMRIRAKAVSVATAIVGFVAGIEVFFFLTMVNNISYAGVFYIFGFISVLGVVFVYFLLPETRGVKLEDVGSLFDPVLAEQRSVTQSAAAGGNAESGEERHLLG